MEKNSTEKLMEEIYNEVKEIKRLQEEQLNDLNEKHNTLEKRIENLEKTEKLHYEYMKNKFNRIEQKIDSNFKYLNEKIDNNKNKLISEISDMLEGFSIATTKTINNLENKIRNEEDERIIEISKIKGMNDYHKIILKNLESRISILEEESEKYIVN